MILQAKPEDVLLCLPLLHEMREDRRTLGRVDPVYFREVWSHLLDIGVGLMLMSFDESGECDGVLSGLVDRDFVTGIKTYKMATAYAKRGHKRSAMPFVMLRKAERWAKEKGARVMFCGSLAGDDRQTNGFLLSMGYKPSDQAFVKELK